MSIKALQAQDPSLKGLIVSDSLVTLDLSTLDPDGADAERFGGKALGLACLRHDGLPTPAGFAVSASTQSPEAWPEEVRCAFAICCAALLAHGPVAVRSSGLGEDSAQHSFAGLFETTLGVEDLQHAFSAAATCIASGKSERVLSYAGTERPIPVGVVVQQMVTARVAGVLFTRDPAGRDPALVIEATTGTGDALVSGRAHPEHWRIYRTGVGTVEARRSPRPGGEGPVLTNEEALSLATTAWELARRWAQDLDLEWAIDHSGATFWLQARPITTDTRWHPPVVSRSSPHADDGPVTVWANWNIRESIPEPLTPLSWAVLRETLVPVLTRDVFGVPEASSLFTHASVLDLVDGRVYYNMNALIMLGSLGLGSALAKLLRFIDERAAITTMRLITEGVLRPRRLPGRRSGKMSALLHVFLGSSRRLFLLLQPQKALQAMAEAGARCGTRPPVRGMDDQALLRELQFFSVPEAGALHDGLAMVSFALLVWLLADGLFRPWPAARCLLATGVEGNPTTQISVGVDELVEAARPLADYFASTHCAHDLLETLRATASQDVGVKHWLDRLDDFLACYGHRAPQELELSVPRWVDDPSMILELVRTQLVAPAHEGVADRLRRLRKEREARIAAAVAAAPFWKRPLLRWLAKGVPAYMPLREAPKHHAMQLFLRTRRAALEIGRRLVERGVCCAADEVFFLDSDEIEALLCAPAGPPPDNLRHLVTQRREKLASFRVRKATDFVRSDGVPVEEPEDVAAAGSTEERSLRGVGIGGGCGEGPVKVLHSPDPRQVKDGDVLVMEFADPGWTPLFPRAAAVVMEVGGTLSHAAVVARELGIPAVFGVKDATQLLQDGERVIVDGNEGRVYPWGAERGQIL